MLTAGSALTSCCRLTIPRCPPKSSSSPPAADTYARLRESVASCLTFMVRMNYVQVRFNPNLYSDGKVCLSLLGTWSGPGWIPNQSTLAQVCA
jgi:hypothetical protein